MINLPMSAFIEKMRSEVNFIRVEDLHPGDLLVCNCDGQQQKKIACTRSWHTGAYLFLELKKVNHNLKIVVLVLKDMSILHTGSLFARVVSQSGCLAYDVIIDYV